MNKEILFEGKKIAYTKEGTGPCLVLLHGFPMDRRVWDVILPDFQKQFNVIAIDLPGFGRSDMISENHSMELIAKVVFEILKIENIKETVLAGHSMGGYAALAFAAFYPEMLKGLVLFHSHALADDEIAKTNRLKAIEQIKTNKEIFLEGFIEGLFDSSFSQQHPETVALYKEIAASQKTEAITAGLLGIRDRKTQLETLIELNCPVLFILGKNDSRMPYTNILAQVALPAHAELLLLDKIGHMGFAEASEKTQKAISAFVNRNN